MSDYRIDDGMEVTLHFTVKLEDDTVIDSTREKEAATFQVGDGNLPPGFEAPLKGMSGGESGRFTITPEHGFGQHNPQNVQRLPRDQFEDELEVGTVMSFTDPGGWRVARRDRRHRRASCRCGLQSPAGGAYPDLRGGSDRCPPGHDPLSFDGRPSPIDTMPPCIEAR